jgi:hypothetical protein
MRLQRLAASRRETHLLRVLLNLFDRRRPRSSLRIAARYRGGPLPSIDVEDALLDERRGLTARDYNPWEFLLEVPARIGVRWQVTQNAFKTFFPHAGAGRDG